MSKAKQPVTITSRGRSVTFQALMGQTDGYGSSVPSFPVETGFNVSDSIIIESPTLSMTLYLARTPVTWRGYRNQVEHNVSLLEDLYFQKDICSVSTSDRFYGNMAIESLSIVKSEDLGYDRQVDISFKKINVTATRSTSIPASYGKSGATGATAGAASTTQKASKGGGGAAAGSSSGSAKGSGGGKGKGGTKSSVLYGLAGSIGLV